MRLYICDQLGNMIVSGCVCVCLHSFFVIHIIVIILLSFDVMLFEPFICIILLCAYRNDVRACNSD